MFSMFYFTAKKVAEYKLNLNSLYDLYLPVVGQTATNFYMLLNNIVNDKNSNLTFNSESICKQLEVTNAQLVEAKEKLEAMGLISTYMSVNNNKDQILIFVLNSALGYDEFISNPKFKALLINKIGTTNFEYIEYKHAQSIDLTDAIDVSSSFDKVFNDAEIKKVRLIDFEKLYKNIQLATSLPIVMDDSCKNIIQDVYAKYAISLKDIEMVIYESIYDMNGHNEVNANLLLQNFNKLVSGNITTSLANVNRDSKIFYGLLNAQEEEKIINDYKVCSPELYLASIFKKSLSQDEKNIILTLRSKYHLNDEVINVLLDFSLIKTNGQLNKKYITKAAHSINGLGLIDAKQVINHFKKSLTDKSVNKVDEEIEYQLESI